MAYTYKKDHIPITTPNKRRPSIVMVPATITIHNTGNAKSTANNERTWLTNPSNNRQASYHIVVDATEAIECIPLNEVSYHAGDATGNRTSIGIEICETNYIKSLENAVDLTAKLLKERGWDVSRLRRHYDWSGKICPRLMYSGGKWSDWDEFKSLVKAKMEEDVVDKVAVYVWGKKVEDGYIKDGRVYVPLRETANAIGSTIKWDSKTKTAEILKGGN